MLPSRSPLEVHRSSSFSSPLPSNLSLHSGQYLLSDEAKAVEGLAPSSVWFDGEVLNRIQPLFPNLTTTERLKSKAISTSRTPSQPSFSTPVRIGVVLSGGPAAGGHNVICGLFRELKRYHANSVLLGFMGGPKGVMEGKFKEIDEELVNHYENTGGFDIVSTGRDKIEKPEQFKAAKDTVTKLKLDGLVVIGGDDSNTNAAVLAEYFLANNVKTRVIGCPKTIDGDLKNKHVEISFGFDTAAKTYSELIGNIMTDARSSGKYYHFIRLMGRSASHLALECALQTRPNAVILGEEMADKDYTLADVSNYLTEIVIARAQLGFNFGVFLIPEGLVEFIPEVGELIQDINDLLAKKVDADKVRDKLSESSQKVFDFLPDEIRNQLMLERDPHGNVQVSRIETEKLLIRLVEKNLEARKAHYKGKFNALSHFFGYEGRCALPSNFDCNYCKVLGHTAAILLTTQAEHGYVTGMMAIVRNLSKPMNEWIAGGYPIVKMMAIERRRGKEKPVIKKALVDLNGIPFETLVRNRGVWALQNCYQNPGPIQFCGPTADMICHTLLLEHGGDYKDDLERPGLLPHQTSKL